MTHLRFTPAEHQALLQAARQLDLRRCTPDGFRHVLVTALSATAPALAGRVAWLNPRELNVLRDHLKQRQGKRGAPELTTEEFVSLAGAFGLLLFQARFSRALRSGLLSHLRKSEPGLAAKIERLNPAEFEALCERVRERISHSSDG